jgi:ubiquinone biosynthesis protein UbiJ
MDNATLSWIVEALLGALCCVLWSNLNDVKRKADKVAEDLADYKTQSASTYITKVELKDAVESLNQAFERHASRIDARLDRLEEHIMEMKKGK